MDEFGGLKYGSTRCPLCNRSVALKKDGTTRQHRCAGSAPTNQQARSKVEAVAPIGEVTVKMAPPTLTMYLCDRCGTFKQFAPLGHRTGPSGPICRGRIVKVRYVISGFTVLDLGTNEEDGTT